MSNYVITCCSTSDMPASFYSERHIPFVSFHYTIDGKLYHDDMGKTMSFKEFYDTMRTGVQPTTSQVNVDEYMEFFEPFLKNGQDVLHVCLSSGISGAYNAACVAREQLAAQYPDRKIAIVDSLGASSGYGLLMDMLADVRDGGASFEEAVAWAEENKLTIHHWFYSSDLTFYIKGGRISKAAGMLGTLLGICPLLNMNSEGKLIPREKVQGRKKSLKVLAEKVASLAEPQEGQTLFIGHGDCQEDAEYTLECIRALGFQPKEVLICAIGAIIGAHSGPGTLAVFFLAKER